MRAGRAIAGVCFACEIFGPRSFYRQRFIKLWTKIRTKILIALIRGPHCIFILVFCKTVGGF